MAGTLEWAVPVPAPNYNFQAPPVVDRRYPLWKSAGDDVVQREPAELEFVEELRVEPDHHRATLVTSVVNAEPQGLWNLTGPSYVPVLTAFSVTMVALGPIVQAYWLMALGAAAAIVLLAIWLWPSPDERERLLHDPLNERLNLPLEGRGTREAGWWGVMLFLVAVGAAYGICLFAYFYLRLYSGVWPQDGLPLPDLTVGGALVVLLLTSMVQMSGGARAIREGNTGALSVRLWTALLMSVAVLALLGYMVFSAGFAPQDNAYASVYFALAGLTMFTTLLASALCGALILRNRRGHFDERFNASVQHTAMVWNFAAAANVVTLAVVQLTPHLV